MNRFGVLLGLAFVDLAVAGVMLGRGERGLALLFVVLAVLTAGFALFAKPALRRDPRGRLQAVDPPFARVLGFAGAVAILGAGGYVALSAGGPVARSPSRPAYPAPVAAPMPPAAPGVRPARRAPESTGNWLHKCVDDSGHASFQSAPCGAGTRQAWRRPVTPEREPVRSARSSSTTPTGRGPAAARSGREWSQPRVRKENSAACQAARAADHAYRRQPLKYVKHDGLRRHGDAVREACG